MPRDTSDEKTIHFGWFLRWRRAQTGKKIKEMARAANITEKRLIDIMKQKTPTVNDPTYFGLAKAVDMGFDDFDRAWRETPVRKPVLRGNGRGMKVIRVTAETYSRLRILAGNRTVEKYIEELAVTADADVNEPIPREVGPSGETGSSGKPAEPRGTPKSKRRARG